MVLAVAILPGSVLFNSVVIDNNIRRYCLPKFWVLKKKSFTCTAASLVQTRTLCVFVFLYGGEKVHGHFSESQN